MTTHHDSAPMQKLIDETRSEEDRTAARIRELTNQRDEIFRQVDEQMHAALPLPHASIAVALKEFVDFFEGYTRYFWDLLPEQVKGHGRTHESVLNTALNNTRRSWEQLSLAINQRYNPAYQARLREADQIADQLLNRAAPVVSGMKPIVYFDKVFQITRHPFQTCPLLGISPDRFEYDGHSSMAHELGHHVFWNNGDLEGYADRLDTIDMEIARTMLAEKFPDVDFANPATTRRAIRSRFDQYSIWAGWIEETFADIFGTLIRGPWFVKSAQDMLIREHLGTPRDLLINDDVHPVSALRPFIGTATLRAIANLSEDPFGDELNNLVDDLEARWQPIWEEAQIEEHQSSLRRPPVTHLGRANLDEPPAVTLKDLRQQIVPMVNLVLTKIRFASGSVTTQKLDNLLSAVEYWGKDRTADDQAGIAGLAMKLASDPISSIATRIGDRRARQEPQQAPDEETHFSQFLEFVKNRRQTKPDPHDIQLAEWQMVLEFDLTLDHGVLSGCHKHTLSEGTVAC